MASSNRHWPSMFKSKPCNSHHQWQHDLNPTHISSCQRSPFASSGNEERSPDPKPRWNPKPEQIRILEAIFNSGMVNPPRDEIRRIRVQLQEYGQVGDANVFYWFQNRKSRSKHKNRHLHNNTSKSQSASVASTTFVAPSSSSSSSERSPPKRTRNVLPLTGIHVLDSPTSSVNQTYFQTQGDFSTDPFYYHPMPPPTTQGNTNLFFPELANIVHHIPDQVIGPCTGFLLSELFNQSGSKKDDQDKLQLSYGLSSSTNATTTSTTSTTTTLPSTSSINVNQIQGVGQSGGMVVTPPLAAKSTVYINNVAVEVAHGPFNIREAFGEDAVLYHSNGQHVVTNEWGLTLQSLQPGACYYLV
ncbi:hypothetical protein ACHQM5_003398 [Ranunculus cassubicifolius]